MLSWHWQLASLAIERSTKSSDEFDRKELPIFYCFFDFFPIQIPSLRSKSPKIPMGFWCRKKFGEAEPFPMKKVMFVFFLKGPER